MRKPLYKALYDKKNHLSFHTPAHNGGIVIDSKLDVTELSYSDNLLNARGVILESEKEVAKAYGVENVLYSTAGATTLIHTVIRALRGKGKFLIYGDAHKSVYNGLRINCLEAVLYRGCDLEKGLAQSGAKVVICTSPNYFGAVLPLGEIRAICNSYGAILVVDASHGAHFSFSSKLPNSATEYADLVIHSQHKVMPTLTGGASLCYTDEYKTAILRAFQEIHTTSPSYPVMLSIESAVDEYSARGEMLYAKVVEEIEHFTRRCEETSFKVEKTDDLTRLVIDTFSDGEEVARFLEDRGVYPEMVFGSKIVFIVTPHNYEYLDALLDALLDCPTFSNVTSVNYPASAEYVNLEFGADCELIPLEKGEGRVSYQEVGCYPPGVPLVTCGEKITAEQIDFLIKHKSSVFGLENDCLVVVK